MQPTYQITEKMLNLVGRISELATEISIEKRDLHLRKENRLRSIQSSLAIENNSLSLEQVTDLIEGKRVLGPPKDIHEVQNAYEAYELAFKLNPYSVDDFLQAHQLLTRGLVKHAGQFRLGDVGVYDGQGQVVHLGARPQFVPHLVAELFSWAKESQISDLVKSCLVHFELEIIHPFEDGNGRMGRLWQSLILSRFNPIFEWLPIESVVYQRQQGYYHALASSNQANDATAFVEFMLEAIFEALQDYQPLSKQAEKNLKPREQAIFDQLLSYFESQSSITNVQMQAVTGLSQATCRRYLRLFTEKGLLQAQGTTRDRSYILVS